MAYSVTKGVIKIPDAGDECTLHVLKCEVVDGAGGEQVKFTSQNGDQLYMGREGADRQLGDICGFGTFVLVAGKKVYDIPYGDVDGHTLRFYRVPNKNPAYKPYFNIARVSETPSDAPRPSLTAAAKAEAERVRKAKGLPADEDGAMGPTIPGLDEDPAYLASLEAMDEDGMPPVKAGMAQQAIVDAKAAKREEIVEAYRQAWVAALDVQGPDSTPEALNAGAATIMIAWGKAGLV